MLLAMENVLEQAWTFRNTPVPDRCMNPENISEVVYYFLQDKGAEYRAGLLYDRAKAEFDTRMEEIAALPPKEILEHAYEKVIKEEFLGELEQGLDEWETDTLLTCPQPLAALYTEWLDNDFSFWDSIRGTLEETVAKQAADLRRCVFHVNGEPPAEMKDFYDLHGDELSDTGLEPPGRLSGDAAYGQRGAVWPAAPVRRRMGYAKPGDSKPDPGPAPSVRADWFPPCRVCGGAVPGRRPLPAGGGSDKTGRVCHRRR